MSRDESCTHCHVRAPRPERRTCSTCAETRRVTETKLRNYRRKHKLCITCGNRAATKRRYCKRHLAAFTNYNRNYRKRRKVGVPS